MRKRAVPIDSDEEREVAAVRPRWLTRMRWAILGGAFGVGASAFALVSMGQKAGIDPGDGPIQQAVGTVSRGMQSSWETVRNNLSENEVAARNLALENQVRGRIMQEKTIEADRIEIHAENEGTIFLKGLVPNEDHKTKAVSLTRDTRGVLKVVDELAVTPPSRVYDATAIGSRPGTDRDGVRK